MKTKFFSLITAFVMILSFSVFTPEFTAKAYPSAYPLPNLTGNQREDIVNIALSQKGYKKSGGTVYGAWYDSIKGTNFTNAAWCAMFVSWCANQAGIGQDILTYRSYVPDMVSDFKGRGQWHDRNYTPTRGDIIIVNSSGHVGIVTGVSGSTVYTIEGNKTSLGSACGTDSYTIGSSYITGYGSPNYNDVPIPNDDELGIPYPRPQVSSTVWLGKNGITSGNYVKWLQTALNKADNAGLVVDGQFGAGTTTAVKNFQSKYGLTQDGQAGTATINKLVEVIKSQMNPPRPSWAWISATDDRTSFAVGEEIHFWMSADESKGDITHYLIGINKGDERIITEECNGDYYVSFDEPGNYSVYVSAYNTTGWWADSNIIYFTIKNKPSWAWISATDDRTSFAVGEEIHFWMSADETNETINHYLIGINKNDERIITEECNGDYYISFDEPGNYSVYVSAYNSIGWADSNIIYFTIKNKPSWAWISATDDRTSFAVGEEIHFLMSADETNETINHYLIGINKDDERIITEECNGDYYISFDEPGNYSVYVSAYNSIGWADSNIIYFVVNSVKVNFNANGGSTSVTNKTVTYNEKYGDLPTPTREGYIFEGWYTKEDGGTEITSDTIVTVTSDQTLYAHWTLIPVTTTTVTTTTTTTTTTTAKPILSGDTNDDGQIDIADVVAVSSYVGDSKNNPLSDEAIIAGDVHNTGDGITSGDVLMIQQYIVGIIAKI